MIRNRLFNPGPATTSDSVKRALVVPDICPREKEFGAVVKRVREKLMISAGNPADYDAVLLGGSGTAAVESMITSLVPKNGKLAVIVNGAYGKRMVDMAKTFQMDVISFDCADGTVPEMEKLADFLRKNAPVSHLAVVHHETSTGILNPLPEIDELAKKLGISVLLDAMSSFGALPISLEHSAIEALAASSNKCLQGMAGIGVVIAKTAALRKPSASRSFYLDLNAQFQQFERDGQFRFTPPVQVLYAFEQAVDEFLAEGRENRMRRYSENWTRLKSGMEERGFRFSYPAAPQSHILMTFDEPDGFDFETFHDRLFEQGFTVYPGKVGAKKTFRLSVLGDLNRDDIEAFLAAVDGN